MALKGMISPPLEAGTSILDGHNLPAHLHTALEYTSKRLTRKSVHLTLVVVRRDYQIPSSALSTPPSARTPTSPPPSASVPGSATNTPTRPAFNLAAIKNIVRSNAFTSQPQGCGNAAGTPGERCAPAALDLERNGMASPAFSISSLSSASTSASTASSVADSTFSCHGHRLRWPLSPGTPSSMPMTPATPFTVGSSATTTDLGSAASGASFAQDPDQFGIRLVHVSPVALWEEKLLRQSFEKAGRKFHIGSNWLPNALPPSAYGLNAELMRRSLSQNEVLFSSEGLTLLSFDHLYTFKAALASYARTQAPRRLEDAVDELRRLFLSRGRQRLRKSALAGTYPWLGPVSDSALGDVARMYRRAYGGPTGESGLENDDVSLDSSATAAVQSPPSPVVVSSAPPRRESARSWLSPHRPAPKGCLLGEKPLPALPAAASSEEGQKGGADEEMGEVKNGASSSSYSSSSSPRSASPSRTRDRDPEKRFCVEFGLDFDLRIEEYYRTGVRDAQKTEEEQSRLEAELEKEKDNALEEMRRTTPRTALSPPPLPKMPVLKLQTTFDKKPGLVRPVPSRQLLEVAAGGWTKTTTEESNSTAGLLLPPLRPSPQQGKLSTLKREGKEVTTAEKEVGEEEEEEEEEELTARPKSGHPNTLASGFPDWNRLTINELLFDTEPRTSHLGPLTPNEYDDISPVTRGEWGFLMVGDAWKARTVAVEMC